jgi:excisionase family DNA binding protein
VNSDNTKRDHADETEATAKGLPMLLTISEAAALLRTTTKAVYSMADRGKLPGVVKVGRRTLVRRADLLRSLGIGRGSSTEERR